MAGKMLVIDDDPTVLSSCQRIFAAEGFYVVTTTSPEEGLSLVLDTYFDVILCGKQAIDDDSGAVGPALAQFLGIPYLTSIVELEITAEQNEARAAREIEGGREVVTLPLPALFSAQKGLNEPRIPQVAGVMKAMKAQIGKIDLQALGLSPEDVRPRTKILKFHPPRKRPGVKMIEEEFPRNVEVLVKILREEEKVI